MSDIYHTAKALAADLAEDHLAAEIGEMMIEGARTKAAAIRARSEAQKGWLGGIQTPEDRYHNVAYDIYGAVYQLLEGYKGWRLVRDTEETDATP